MIRSADEMPTTEQANERSKQLDRLTVREIVELMNEEDRTVADSVHRALPSIAAAIEAISAVVERGGRLFYIGAGTSGRLGILDASECPPTFGVDPEMVVGLIAGGEGAITRAIENAEDDTEAGIADIGKLVTSRDAVVGIAASGRTPYVMGALREAARIGALTASLSCNADSPISEEADYPIEVPVGAEIVTGSTRLKAGTATKMVLNMITTATMIRLGKVYGNLMVNVQATNDKLRERVVRIVAKGADCDEQTASKYVLEAGGDARVAILMIKFGVTATRAIEALRLSNGHFGKAINQLSR
ncbi:N-acetylmuramic acid 6-phosphate etherase [Cohnella thailandensis]|uniref:N-acetylmuramic acid 6-phosphate etherase n=1 Tax=Cohnella thailandensis TaxID=557557 RepID=A0A841T0N2_9BACL|nr:N-acetylmuramic acid 6-phosphate etherase [Cohnella thailandensis]MBB6635427.1 N-acetylmuramic acid 6-phosphate etherase [Cohnella thailandensis]MBP1974807.1 N-acetylmuramic acid 6-phosphate etherase [Cohnella thailandensis]